MITSWLVLAMASSITASSITASSAAAPAPRHRVPDGFIIEQAAGAEEVVFPMFAAFDDRGRLFVTESSGLDLYAEVSALTRKCKVRLLEDRDGDGRFESSRVFADKLVFPMGLAWREEKLYVADPPDLVTLEDKDGDGRADERKVILSGFGHTDNGSLHGITFGPDRLLYMTMGRPDGYRFVRSDGSVLEGTSGALLRSRPDGSGIEVLCRGFENLVEIAFLPSGEVIGTDNWFQLPSGGLRDALVHLVDGGLYPSHQDVGTPLPITGNALPAAALFPAVALSGLVRYRGSAFPEPFRGNLFSAQHNARRVGRHVLSRAGSTFRSQDFDFVSSDDPDFHPSDVLEAADGSLLVVDTGGWYVQHCPTGRIRDSRAPGGIYRARCLGGRAIGDPWGLEVDWKKASADELCALLSDPRPAVRDRAERALTARGEEASRALASSLKGEGLSVGREHALWALSAIPGDSSVAILRQALSGSDTVALSARALGIREDRKSEAALCGLLSHAAPHVRMAAAEALARSGGPGAAGAILKALGAEPDRFLEHALIHALYRIARAEDLERALEDPPARAQKAALLLLDQREGKLEPEQVIARLSSPDLDLRQTALRILERHSKWAGKAAGIVKEWLQRPELTSDEKEALRALILAFPAEPEIASLVGAALVDGARKALEERSVFLLETLARTNTVKVPRPWVDAFKHLIEKGPDSLRHEAVRAAAVLQVPELDEDLLKLLEGKEGSVDLQLEALRAVISRHPRLSGSSFDLLMAQLSEGSGPVSRLAAAEVLARSDLEDAQLSRLLKALRGDALVSPNLLLGLLERSVSARTSSEVLDYLEEAVRAGWHPDEKKLVAVLGRLSAQEKGAKVLDLVRQGVRDQKALLARYEQLLSGGDAGRGRTVFFGKKVACSTCHRVGAEGGEVGPDLTKVGAIRSGRDILESIVFPSSTFAQGYDNYVAVTKDGRVTTGIISRQSAGTVVLRDSSGKDSRLIKEEIQELERLPTSLMPEGLDRAITQEELRDLLAFLGSLR